MGNYNSWEFWTYYRNHLTGKIEKSPQRFMLTLEDAYRLLVEYLQSDEIVEILSFDYGRITGIYL